MVNPHNHIIPTCRSREWISRRGDCLDRRDRDCPWVRSGPRLQDHHLATKQVLRVPRGAVWQRGHHENETPGIIVAGKLNLAFNLPPSHVSSWLSPWHWLHDGNLNLTLTLSQTLTLTSTLTLTLTLTLSSGDVGQRSESRWFPDPHPIPTQTGLGLDGSQVARDDFVTCWGTATLDWLNTSLMLPLISL